MTIGAAVDLLTTGQAAELARVKPAGVHRLLHRAGIRPVGREPGRAGQNLYDAAQVRAALQARPGRWPNRSGREQMRYGEGHQVAAAEALAIKDDPVDLAEIRAIQQDMAALHER